MVWHVSQRLRLIKAFGGKRPVAALGLRNLAAIHSNQNGAGNGSLLARDTLTESAEYVVAHSAWQLDVWGIQGTSTGLPQSRLAALSLVALASDSISHLFLECPAAVSVISWLCRLWHAMTGHMPQASVAILAAATAEGQCASEALLTLGTDSRWQCCTASEHPRVLSMTVPAHLSHKRLQRLQSLLRSWPAGLHSRPSLL